MAEVELRTSVTQQEARAVSPIRRDIVDPVPATTVVALHQPLGIVQKLKNQQGGLAFGRQLIFINPLLY